MKGTVVAVLFLLLVAPAIAGCAATTQTSPSSPPPEERGMVSSDAGAADARVLPLSPEHPVRFDRAPAVDPVIVITGPATVFAHQSGRFKILVEVPPGKSGPISLPLRLMDDQQGEIIVGMYEGLRIGLGEADLCIVCIKCCPPLQP